MWLDNIRELKKDKNVSNKWIAEQTGLPVRTVDRVFAGDTDNPYVDTLHRIVKVLGGSLDGILADTKMVVGGADLITLQGEVDRLTAEVERLSSELALVTAENVVLKDKADAAENELKDTKLTLQEEIISIHKYYIEKERSKV